MKPITFENLRRLIGGGRKKNKDKDGSSSSFKRSDSFKRISIRRSYLDRGKKKVVPKLEVATQTVTEEELSFAAAAASNAAPFTNKSLIAALGEVKKVDSSVQVDKVDLNATIKSGKEIYCNNINRRKSENSSDNNSVMVYNQWLQEIKRDDNPRPPPRTIKGSERTIIYVPASDEKVQVPIIRQLSSSPTVFRKNTSSTHISHIPSSSSSSVTNLQRTESNDSAVEMFPWGDSTEVMKKSPLIIRRRSRQSPAPILLPADSGSEEMCSLSISLGRIWMDAPQVMTPRSLEMPKSSSISIPAPSVVHHSLDSGLKDLREDPIVLNRLQKRSTPPVTRTLSSTSNNTNSTGLFSSKDSGFSFSISAPKLSDFHANFSPNPPSNKGGFFRKKSKPKPKLSVSRDGYFKRTSSAMMVETRRNSIRRSSKKKKNKVKKNKKKEKDCGTIRSDIYQVICSRPQRAINSLKLDPMIFVPPEKRKAGSHQKPSFRDRMQEIRNFNPLESNMYSTTRSMESTDEGLYESLPGDYEYLTDDDDEEINLESFSMEVQKKEIYSEENSSGYGVVRQFNRSISDNYYNSSDQSRFSEDSKKKDHRYSYRESTNNLEDFSEEDTSLVSILNSDNSSDDDDDVESDEQRVKVYIPPGVSPVPRRRPVRRKKSTGLNHKRSITYLVKPTVIRAPSTLKRPNKKIELE